MTAIQQTFAYVNARFFSLLDQVQAGTLSSVSIISTAGGSVVAKIVAKADFDAAIALGGVVSEIKVPQLPYGMTPQRLGFNGLYKLVKQLRDDNATVESSLKASLSFTKNVTATSAAYNDGGGNGLTLTAKTTGLPGNLLTFTVVTGVAESVAVVGNDTTLTLNTGTSTLTSIASTLGAPSVPFTVAINGVGATVAFVHSLITLAGGDTGSVTFTSRASGSVGNSYTVRLLNPGMNTASTTAAIVGNDVTVTMRYGGGNVLATLAEIASVVTAASSTLRMTALATGTTTLVPAAAGPTHLAGGVDGTGHKFIAYDVTRTMKASPQAELLPTASTVRAVMIPKALADQIGL